jgi:hypothetical protein
MSDFIYTPDHAARAEGDLVSKLRKGERLGALARALGHGAQVQEDEFFSLVVDTTLTGSTGKQLEQWGEYVGEQRGGLSDNDYRRFIEARIAANLCEGDVDALLEVFEILTDPVSLRYFPHYPAGFRLACYRTEWMSDQVVRRVGKTMRDVTPAGVAMSLSESLIETFEFTTAGQGYGTGLARSI